MNSCKELDSALLCLDSFQFSFSLFLLLMFVLVSAGLQFFCGKEQPFLFFLNYDLINKYSKQAATDQEFNRTPNRVIIRIGCRQSQGQPYQNYPKILNKQENQGAQPSQQRVNACECEDMRGNQIQMSRAWSYLTVGMTELINFKKMIKAWCGLIFLPLALDSSMNRFMTSECLQGWMVSMRQSRNTQFSSVTVSFWYSEYMSWKMSLEVSGLPLQSLPFIQSLGVKQYSSQETYISYLRKSYSTYSASQSPVISTKPHSSLFLLSTIACLVSLWMRWVDVAAQYRYCFEGFGSSLLCFIAFCHFHPKFVSWSPATTNCSGESTPLPSKSLSLGVNLEFTKFFNPSNIIIIEKWELLSQTIFLSA